MALIEKFHNRLKHNNEFNEIFHPLKMKNFNDILTGFDVIAFESALNVPDGVSCKEYIRENYGEEAVKLIVNLIDGV